jgi:hypothetical protein
MGKIPLVDPKALRIIESVLQDTPDLAVPLTPGPVKLIPASGKIDRAKADTVDNAKLYGILIKKAPGNSAGTLIRLGVVGGYDFTGVNFDTPIYLDNDGDLNTAPGTQNKRVGRVIPLKGQLHGLPYNKALSVELAQ